MEPQGPLGTVWAGAGLIAFFIGLIWLNLLLGLFLTPLMTFIPFSWLMDWAARRRRTDETK